MEAQFAVKPQSQKLAVYVIHEREGLDRSIWTKVGAAFKNRDGSYNLHLDALPTNGKLHIREYDPNKKWEKPEARVEEVHS